MPVIDASVYVALMRADEPAHERCWEWFRQAGRAENAIAAPTILLAEAAAALSRGMGDRAFAHRAIQQLLEGRIIQMFPVTEAMAVKAAEIAADYHILGCDSVYVALAVQLEDGLVTLDREQLDRAAPIVATWAP